MTDMYLTEPGFALWRDYRKVCREFKHNAVEDFPYPPVRFKAQFRRYMEYLAILKRGEGLPEGVVPSLEFWLTDGRRWMGSGTLRPYINESLTTFGGHIGYAVRPSEWGRGLGTGLLAMLLDKAREKGVTVARLSCFEENAASARVIEKNGGIIVERVINEIQGRDRLTRLYDIIL